MASLCFTAGEQTVPWEKGKSGNPNGRPRKGKSLTDTLAKATKLKRSEIAEAALDLALGHWKEEVIPKGGRRVYFVSPNIAAIAFLFDRIDGKVAQKIDIGLIIRKSAEAHGIEHNDPRVLAAIEEAERVMEEARSL